MSEDTTPRALVHFSQTVQEGELNAIQLAYRQYMMDDRLDTDVDDEAFMDAIIKNIIIPLEDALEGFVASTLKV